jgi:hypothetical protein
VGPIEVWNNGACCSNPGTYFVGPAPYPYVRGSWARIRHVSATNTIYFENSNDGTNWTQFGSTTPPTSLSNLYVHIITGEDFNGSTVGAAPAIWDNASLVHNP